MHGCVCEMVGACMDVCVHAWVGECMHVCVRWLVHAWMCVWDG
jgi:hypothetical protein